MKRRADIVFNQSGRIDLTARLCKLLQIEQGNVLDVAKLDGEWVLRVGRPSVGGNFCGTIKTVNQGSAYKRAHSKSLAAKIAEITGRKDNRLIVGEKINEDTVILITGYDAI